MNPFQFAFFFLLFYAFGWLVSRMIAPPFYELLRAKNGRPNFQDKQLPCGSGVLLLFVSLIASPLQLLSMVGWWKVQPLLPYTFWLGLTLVTLAGWVDDVWGSHEQKGLRGHLRLLWTEGKVTTGTLKVFLVGMAALLSATPWTTAQWNGAGVFQLIAGAALVASTSNAVNLLDTRPGRALKFFFLALVFFVLLLPWLSPTAGQAPEFLRVALLQAPLLAAAVYLLQRDLAVESMVGDSGSNALGYVLGFLLVHTLAFKGLLAALGLFLLLNLVAERISLGKVIERYPLLTWVDRWGRKGN